MRRLPALVTTLALALATLAAVVPADAAFVPAGRPALTAFSHLAVDESHGRLFFSQGSAGGVLVTDLAGATTSTLTALSGATDLLVDPSGDVVWAALPVWCGRGGDRPGRPHRDVVPDRRGHLPHAARRRRRPRLARVAGAARRRPSSTG